MKSRSSFGKVSFLVQRGQGGWCGEFLEARQMCMHIDKDNICKDTRLPFVHWLWRLPALKPLLLMIWKTEEKKNLWRGISWMVPQPQTSAWKWHHIICDVLGILPFSMVFSIKYGENPGDHRGYEITSSETPASPGTAPPKCSGICQHRTGNPHPPIFPPCIKSLSRKSLKNHSAVWKYSRNNCPFIYLSVFFLCWTLIKQGPLNALLKHNLNNLFLEFCSIAFNGDSLLSFTVYKNAYNILATLQKSNQTDFSQARRDTFN